MSGDQRTESNTHQFTDTRLERQQQTHLIACCQSAALLKRFHALQRIHVAKGLQQALCDWVQFAMCVHVEGRCTTPPPPFLQKEGRKMRDRQLHQALGPKPRKGRNTNVLGQRRDVGMTEPTGVSGNQGAGH